MRVYTYAPTHAHTHLDLLSPRGSIIWLQAEQHEGVLHTPNVANVAVDVVKTDRRRLALV